MRNVGFGDHIYLYVWRGYPTSAVMFPLGRCLSYEWHRYTAGDKNTHAASMTKKLLAKETSATLENCGGMV